MCLDGNVHSSTNIADERSGRGVLVREPEVMRSDFVFVQTRPAPESGRTASLAPSGTALPLTQPESQSSASENGALSPPGRANPSANSNSFEIFGANH